VFSADLARAEDWLPVIKEAQPDYIIHLAGISFAASGNLKAYYDVNTVGTQHVLEAVAKSGLDFKKIITASSAAVYGALEGGELTEEHPLRPQSHYGISKLATEHVARLFFDCLPIMVVRPFNYTGRGQPENFVVPKIIAHFEKHAEFIELGNIDVEREFNDISYACDVYERLLRSEKAVHDAVNLCTGRGVTLRSVIEDAEKLYNHKIEIRINPAFVRPNEARRMVGNPEKLNRMIDPVAVCPFYETLETVKGL
ncbi:MAG: GDP-mannose 4,6-dehydratase, partial [Micavibrio sp.]